MPMMSGGDAVTGTLLAHGIGTVYGLPGVQSDHLFNALFDAGDRIEVIHTRHEQGAAYMALGAALATGRPQACSVVPGPGVLNASAALATAFATGAPLLCLAGQIPSAAIGKGLGYLHELPDQLAILSQLTKYAARAATPAEAARLTADAIHAMTSGRTRPAAVELPQDVLAARADVTIPGPRPAAVPPPPPAGDIDRAADLMRRAEHPLILTGAGAMDAGLEVRLLAERLGAPVVLDMSGRGLIDGRHPLAHTLAGGHRLWQAADLVIVAGMRPSLPLLAWGFDERLRIVQIDIDPAEIGRVAPADVGLVGDAGATLRLLLEAIREPLAAAKRRIEASVAVQAEVARDIAHLQPQLAYLDAIRATLPEDGYLVDELTQMGFAARIAWPATGPRTFVMPGYQGTLGWGVAATLGVKHAVGDKAVVGLAGDGGFMYTMPELATAVRHRIGAVIVLFNDNAFGNVRRMQQENYGNRVIASDLANPDFMKLADSFGIGGARAGSPEQLRIALDKALASGEPWLIEVPVGPMPSPWRHISMPRIRG